MNPALQFIIVLILASVMVGSLATKEVKKRTPVPVEVTQPEQSHYAVFYVICGALQHILMTTQPPLRHSMGVAPSQEMLDLLKATSAERIIELRYMGPECYYANPRQAPVEPIL